MCGVGGCMMQCGCTVWVRTYSVGEAAALCVGGDWL